MPNSPIKLRYPLLALIGFIIYSYATYQHPQYAEGHCPKSAQRCECVDDRCAMIAYYEAQP